MDPNATLAALRAAQRDYEREASIFDHSEDGSAQEAMSLNLMRGAADQVNEHLNNLLTWLRLGGFAPDWQVQ